MICTYAYCDKKSWVELLIVGHFPVIRIHVKFFLFFLFPFGVRPSMLLGLFHGTAGVSCLLNRAL